MKRVIKLSGAEMDMSGKNEFYPGTSDKFVRISGSKEAVEKAEKLLQDQIANTVKIILPMDKAKVSSMMKNNWKETIQIETATGAALTLSGKGVYIPGTQDEYLTICGSKEAVDSAEEMIQRLMEDPMLEKWEEEESSENDDRWTAGDLTPRANLDGRRLRPIVIDGYNVAMGHGTGNEFSATGIKIVVDFFKARGHSEIVVFVHQHRTKTGEVANSEVLKELVAGGVIVREVGKDRIASFDHQYVLDYAAKHGGVVVTQDDFKELVNKMLGWAEVVQKRILTPTFVHGRDEVLWPKDPLGKDSPSLQEFLSFDEDEDGKKYG